jgi:hypothetical protein
MASNYHFWKKEAVEPTTVHSVRPCFCVLGLAMG